MEKNQELKKVVKKVAVLFEKNYSPLGFYKPMKKSKKITK